MNKVSHKPTALSQCHPHHWAHHRPTVTPFSTIGDDDRRHPLTRFPLPVRI